MLCEFGRALVLSTLVGSSVARAQELPNLPPITPEELTLKDNPASPGAAAVILYYAVDTDNQGATETQSMRIKVLREEGKKYADVEIPYIEKLSQVEGIRARTVSPEGNATEFADQVFDREIVKARKSGLSAKVFSLANVRPGTIIEYSFRVRFKEKIPDVFQHPERYSLERAFVWPAANWEIQRGLFVKHGHFVLHFVKGGQVRACYVNMPKEPVLKPAGENSLQIDVEDISAFEEEDFSPPAATLRSRVDLFYGVQYFPGSSYWLGLARSRAREFDEFIGDSKAIRREAQRIVAAEDSSEAKLRKLYARSQQIRALGYEPAKSDKEKKQESLKENKHAEDILNRGYATGNEINLFFVALARAAGFHASPLLVTSRDQAFFMADDPDPQQLNAMVVAVSLGAGNVYLDPATRFCPYGLIPWSETGAAGIVTDTFQSQIGSTPSPKSSEAVTRIEGGFHLSSDGQLSGTTTLSYFGQEALRWRLSAVRKDDAQRRKDLEESLTRALPHGATADLVSTSSWESTDAPFKAEFRVQVPQFATPAGKRLILPLNVFQAVEKNPFASGRRVHNVYFDYPYETYQDVKVELPAGMEAESLPGDRISDQGAGYYEISAKKEGNALRLRRTVRMAAYQILLREVPALRLFYNRILDGDAQQATLRLSVADKPN